MKISLTCKLDPAGAYGFIKPISDIKEITEIHVFRDSEALECEKVVYHTSIKNVFWKQLSKLFKMFRIVDKEFSLSIGIYEIPHGLLAFIIGKIYKIPTVISIIGNPAYTNIRKGIRKKITYYMYKRIHAVTVTGTKSKQVVVNNGIQEDKVYVLPNSIDVEKISPINSSDKEYDLISLGRLSPEKELCNLLKIVAILRQSMPNIKLGIAGNGPEFDLLDRQIIENDLVSNVKLLGFVDNIVEFYNNGKIFVLTSNTEGLPRSIIEAMACGIPCVASDVGDMEDIIDDGLSGYLIQNYTNLNDYADKIIILLNNNEEYIKMSEKSINKIRNNYSYEAATRVWEEIIRKIGD
jgi:glycosyltransferase involved in cell wall biosynthesis